VTVAVGTLLTLPGVLRPEPFAGVAVERTGIFYVCQHLGTGGLIALALARGPRRWTSRTPVRGRVAVAAVALTVLLGTVPTLLAWLGPAGVEPLLTGPGGTLLGRPARLVIPVVVLVVLLGVAVHGVLAGRLHRRLESWALLSLLAATGNAALTALSSERWTVAWYGARGLSVAGAAVLVTALLHETYRLQERTRVIAEQLAAQNAELTEAQGLRDHLVAVVSHDMRSPLAGLLGYLEVLERDPTLSDEEVQRMHARSRLLTRRLIMLTEDLLASATSEGLLVLPEEIDLRRQLDECVAAFPELSVIVRCPHDLQVMADPLRLQQILTNLVRNAQKHGAEPVRVHVAALSSSQVQVTVSDAGPGVPPEFVPRMFDRYTRGPGRSTHGSGLGLFVARSMAERHGGSLDYDPATRSFVLVVPRVRQRPNLGRSFARKALTPSVKSEPV
jgi:signal transduction histidine kinase